jgi:hypothetical protein
MMRPGGFGLAECLEMRKTRSIKDLNFALSIPLGSLLFCVFYIINNQLIEMLELLLLQKFLRRVNCCAW